MNKIYKVIWNRARNCYVVVSEIVKRNTKGSGVAPSSVKTARVFGALLLCACLAGGYNIQAAYAEDEINEAGVAGTNVSRAGYSNASAWGNSTTAKGVNATAWGLKTLAEGSNSTAWGNSSKALNDNSTAFGSGSVANGMNSLAALGGTTDTNATGSVAIGFKSSASGMHSIAIGMEAAASLAHSIALGSYSVANRSAGVAGFNPGSGSVTGNAWVATQSAVAVGASANSGDTATVTRQITGVAAGTFDTDAVNVAQLKAAMKNAGSGQTYTAGDGILIDDATNKISVKSGAIASGAEGFAKAAAVYTEVRPRSNGNYVKTAFDTATNLAILDTQLKQATDAVSTEIANRTTAVSREAATRASEDAALSNRIGSLSANGQYIKTANDVAANLAALDTNLATGLRREAADRKANIENVSRALSAADTALSNRIGSLSANGNYIVKSDSVSKNLSALDTQLKSTATGLQAEIAERKTAVGNETSARISEDTALSNRIGSLNKDGAYIKKNYDVSYNMTILDSQMKAADTAIQTLTTLDIATLEVVGKYAEVVAENKRNIQTNTGDIINLNKKTTDIKTALDKETADRKTADANLGKQIDSETKARIAADTALSDRIGTLAGDGNVIQKDNSVSDNLALLDQALQEQASIDEEILESKADADASNVGKNAIEKDNSAAWGDALGTGAVESKNGKLITGDTVFKEVRTSSDGAYIKAANTAAANLTALDEQMSANTEAIAQSMDEIGQNAADIAANRKQIAANAADIATNTQDIAANRDSIATNAADIATNTKRIATVKTTADTALSGVSALLIGTGLNIEGIVATDQKVNELAANEAVIADRDYTEPVEQDDGTTKDVAKSREFVRGYTVYEYLNGKPGEENAGLTLGQNVERIAIGKGSEASGKESIAIGFGNQVTGDYSGAIGDLNIVAADNSYVVGNNNQVETDDTADPATVKPDNVFAMGNNNTITQSNTFVLGSNVNATGNNTVVLGGGSDDSASVNVTGKNSVVLGVDSDGSQDNVVSVGSVGAERKIVHVAEGNIAEGSTDAVTGGQLYEVNRNAYNNAVYLNNSINRLDSKVNKVGAGAAALAALHPIDMDNKFGMGLGYGNYRDAHSMALGLFYRPQDNLMFSIGGAMGNGENMINAGISIALDKGFSNSKAMMARKIQAQAEELEAQRQTNAVQEEKIQNLEAENEEIKARNARLEARLAAIEAKLGQ